MKFSLAVPTWSSLVVLWTASALAGKPPPPAPPPDPAIAYTTAPLSGSTPSSLMTMNADGTNQGVVVPGKRSGRFHVQPDWSPDGTQVVFVGDDASGMGIYVVNRDGTGLHKIVSTSGGYSVNPVWSPRPVPGIGGSRYRIAYTDVGFGGDLDVWLVDVDGSNPVNVTNSAEAENFPTWSPSGTRLACAMVDSTGTVRDRYGLLDFTTGVRTVAPYAAPLAGRYVGQPAWAKSQEDRMAVVASTTWPSPGYTFDLWLVDPLDPAVAPVPLTNTPTVSEECPSWSPDDSRIVFDTYQVDGVEVMNADGTGRRSLAKPGVQPAWRRNP